jgi:hypothetical protein
MSERRFAVFAVLLGASFISLAGNAKERPDDFEQILERGRISAIDDPVYVDADDALIPDEAWVLGIVVEGRAFAYSVNLLNAHEVVNDKAGDTSFAAVW